MRNIQLAAAAALITATTVVLSGCMPMFLFSGAPQPTAGPSLQSPQNGDFGAQQPSWSPCGDGFECAEVAAPLDWEQPGGERITLSLVKQPATSGRATGTLFVNPGGPGAPGVSYLMNGIDYAVGEPLQEAYDVVAWDPRGVGSSTQVRCLDDAEMDEYLFGLGATFGLTPGSDEWIAAAQREVGEFGAACQGRTGPLLGHVDTISTVRDLDMLRMIVGDDRLNYLGYSYGTYIGARYADAFPDRVGRLVLDGAINPTTTEAEVVREQTIGFEQALRAYVTDCLGRSGCPLSGTVEQAMAQWGALLDRVEVTPLKGSDGRMVTSSTLLTAIITPLYSQGNWPYLDQLYTTASKGDAEVALLLADFYFDRSGGTYLSNQTEAFSAINCLDYPSSTPLDLPAMRQEAAELAAIAPTIGRFQGYGGVFCSAWPKQGVETREPVKAAGAAPILVVGTTGDPATPYRWAVSLAKQLQSGVLVTFNGEGHTAYGGSDCINRVVDDYFLTGAVPATDPQCKA